MNKETLQDVLQGMGVESETYTAPIHMGRRESQKYRREAIQREEAFDRRHALVDYKPAPTSITEVLRGNK